MGVGPYNPSACIHSAACITRSRNPFRVSRTYAQGVWRTHHQTVRGPFGDHIGGDHIAARQGTCRTTMAVSAKCSANPPPPTTHQHSRLVHSCRRASSGCWASAPCRTASQSRGGTGGSGSPSTRNPCNGNSSRTRAENGGTRGTEAENEGLRVLFPRTALLCEHAFPSQCIPISILGGIYCGQECV